MSLASEMLSSMMNFAHEMMRVKEPRELIQLQSEFMRQQGQMFADQSKSLGESIARGANEAEKITSRGFAEASRRGSEAA